MRLSGTEEDLKDWLLFMDAVDRKGLIEILEKSTPYKNRGESKLLRVYLEIDLKVDPN
jgi:hypothetical protein